MTDIRKQRMPWQSRIDHPEDFVQCEEDRGTEALVSLELCVPRGPQAHFSHFLEQSPQPMGLCGVKAILVPQGQAAAFPEASPCS